MWPWDILWFCETCEGNGPIEFDTCGGDRGVRSFLTAIPPIRGDPAIEVCGIG